MAQVKQYSLKRAPNEPGYAALREYLAAKRTQAGLTQAQLAAKIGKPQSFVAKYEVGERYVDAVEMLALARVLALDIRDLSELITASLPLQK